MQHTRSFVVARGLFVAAYGLLLSGRQAPEHTGSVVAAHGVSSGGTSAPEHAGSVAPQRVGS